MKIFGLTVILCAATLSALEKTLLGATLKRLPLEADSLLEIVNLLFDSVFDISYAVRGCNRVDSVKH